MCKECGRTYCVEFCPNYMGRDAERGRLRGYCAACGEGIWEDDLFTVRHRRLLCLHCAARLGENARIEKSFPNEKASFIAQNTEHPFQNN